LAEVGHGGRFCLLGNLPAGFLDIAGDVQLPAGRRIISSATEATKRQQICNLICH
jgi:hypothetical protein